MVSANSPRPVPIWSSLPRPDFVELFHEIVTGWLSEPIRITRAALWPVRLMPSLYTGLRHVAVALRNKRMMLFEARSILQSRDVHIRYNSGKLRNSECLGGVKSISPRINGYCPQTLWHENVSVPRV